MVNVKHRIRYPPFESAKLNADKIPIVEHSFTVEGPVIPSFRLGNEDSWIVERIVEGEHETDSQYHGEAPQIIEKQRTGWYLLPHPIHAKARRFINIIVVVLLLCLFYLFTTPIQDTIGIPTFGTGKVRLGMLDYPLLAVIVVPLMATPIALRVAANLGDLRRQNLFLSNAPASPKIVIQDVKSGSSLKGEITLEEIPENWLDAKATWRVGILPPARHKVFAALGRDPEGQPPPGLTTPLPHHWEEGLDDGTGMGEDAPMQRNDIPGGVFLRPMRIMGPGGTQNIGLDGGKFELDAPKGDWPGTLYGGLVRVHWELIITITRKEGGPLLWVYPMVVAHRDSATDNSDIEISDGRTESDSL
jgi:hypothetical protein